MYHIYNVQFLYQQTGYVIILFIWGLCRFQHFIGQIMMGSFVGKPVHTVGQDSVLSTVYHW